MTITLIRHYDKFIIIQLTRQNHFKILETMASRKVGLKRLYHLRKTKLGWYKPSPHA